ncbi:flagellar M-ring protein FliF [Cerasibacillus quisquiliarum]|uniref:Flagellar M-ring protein n=1 Tax=Cerasibacillus quisquiliarum TaxID=227865 RepID=A0A511UUZ5_9BACI|nr:flagellar basal-body MS-ring/collar protein FliF [Cerasibacillus quisquiliarum]MBB5145854.1 flagellar M-ring protein FliF [Cerasibacillus quisquiliarum]GEN30425.1 flagellar M-ring protein [Cerasibacillus quisquiliarum]
MKEKLKEYASNIQAFWQKRTKNQKAMLIGSTIAAIVLMITIIFFSTKTNFTPLYNNLSMQEANQVKAELDARDVPYELENGGKTINVPEEKVDDLLVELAGQGIPSSGNIDYSFFSENTSWGITDNEFNMLKLDAMQTELANLIKGIDGIQDAKVMINIPKEPLFVNEEVEPASASIVLHTEPGYQFEANQINALYTLVSKAVPNLEQENIAIMNQYFEYFDLDESKSQTTQDTHTYQQSVKKDIERDIQRRVQQMIAAMVGNDNVIVSVTADIDFTQENRVEEIVEPIDEENMEGLPVSIERIQETYSGNPNEVGGIAGVGEEDIAGYQGVEEADDGDYELVKETINNEFNRIKKEIVESPYKIRDLGIQVAVNNIKMIDGDEVEYLTAQEQNVVEEGIASILESMVQTTIDKTYEDEAVDVDEDLMDEGNISVVFQEFSGKLLEDEPRQSIPTWVYFIGAGLLLLVIVLIILFIRNKRESEMDINYVEDIPPSKNEEKDISEIEIDEDSDQVVRRKQLEKMAKEKPEEFAKLLRSWIGEE